MYDSSSHLKDKCQHRTLVVNRRVFLPGGFLGTTVKEYIPSPSLLHLLFPPLAVESKSADATVNPPVSFPSISPRENTSAMATADTISTAEQERAAYLLDAQEKAVRLFEEIERDYIRPGIGEKDLSKEIHELGAKRHGIRTHWHKRVIRSGPNTLMPYEENPPDRIIQPDDILFVDLGPVFEAWEADFGRTFVLGDDPVKKKLRDSLEPVWKEVKSRYQERPDMTGQELYDIACDLAKQAGWEFGGRIAGHLVGSFPHERIPQDKITLYITKGNNQSMGLLNPQGQKRHWILEIHLVDRSRQIGAFFEQLLTVG